MPANLQYSQARVPIGSEANAVPADLARFGDDIDQLLVLKAVDEADRDARYSTVTTGTLVSGTGTPKLWRKSASGWATVWYDSGWINQSLTADPSIMTMPVQLAYRRLGPEVWWRGAIQVQSSYTPNTFATALTMPGEARSPINIGTPYGVNSATVQGQVSILANGELRVWMNAVSSAFIDLSGTRYLAD